MKQTLTYLLLVLAAIFGITIQYNIQAQAANEGRSRFETNRASIPEAPNIEVIVSTAEFKPGEFMKWHYHHGVEVIYVIQGAKVQLSEKANTIFKTGTTLMIPKGVRHEGFKVIGDTSLKLFLVHIVENGKPLFDQEKVSPK